MSNIHKLDQFTAMANATSTILRTSNRYRTIDTQNLVSRVLDDIGLIASIDSVSGRGTKSTKHACVITLDKPVMLAGTPCFPRIYVRNSYAGESALTVRVGFYRLICSNGMMVGTTHFNGRILHLESGIKQLPQLRQSIRDAIEWCTTGLPALADKLNSQVLTPVQVSTILASIGASKRLAEAVGYRLRYPLTSIRQEDRTVDGQLTAWNVWNIINEVQRGHSRSALRQLEVNANLLQAVEEVAHQTAA